jgi:hypothetical protein
MFWLTISWMMTLIWICRGAFRLRSQQIEAAAKRVAARQGQETEAHHYPHPHPPYNFLDVPGLPQDRRIEGLRLRTVMVSNVPQLLRSEKELKEYFEYFMSRPLDKPSVGLPSSTQPGFFNKSFAFVFNRAKHIPAHLLTARPSEGPTPGNTGSDSGNASSDTVPSIERVVIARKMNDLASLLGRREEVLRRLETAHIKLARKTLLAVQQEILGQAHRTSSSRVLASKSTRLSLKSTGHMFDLEHGKSRADDAVDNEAPLTTLIHTLGPFVDEFGLRNSIAVRPREKSKFKYSFRKLRTQGSQGSEDNIVTDTEVANAIPPSYPPSHRPSRNAPKITVWEALLCLDRAVLDPYQPLVNLSHFFRGQTVPAIDYYTAKLELLTSLITEHRAKTTSVFEPASTAFVTFVDPRDARKACKYLAVHPNNPLACLVTMAPEYEDIDWIRVMKSNFGVEVTSDIPHLNT